MLEDNNQAIIPQVVNRNLNISGINDTTQDGRTLLHLAAIFGDLEVLTYLIEERGADVKDRDLHDITPLHLAAWNGHLEVIKYLIEKQGADVNDEDGHYSTPLHYAAEGSHLEVVKYLIEEQGADVDATTQGGVTLLHLAAWVDDPEVVKYLIEKQGADVDATTQDGSTPLHIAMTKNHHEVVQTLVVKGAELPSNLEYFKDNISVLYYCDSVERVAFLARLMDGIRKHQPLNDDLRNFIQEKFEFEIKQYTEKDTEYKILHLARCKKLRSTKAALDKISDVIKDSLSDLWTVLDNKIPTLIKNYDQSLEVIFKFYIDDTKKSIAGNSGPSAKKRVVDDAAMRNRIAKFLGDNFLETLYQKIPKDRVLEIKAEMVEEKNPCKKLKPESSVNPSSAAAETFMEVQEDTSKIIGDTEFSNE